ncbi:unnamed protein product [Rotaria sp. Silwood2]|nr:unnamed protein product [Rotaria sp. Silwood2]CAF4265696.1 unnamed protein product [Rotaria sp. Silwood2]
MVLPQFERLPHELVLNILNYLSTVDGWYSFYNLNSRLNNLLETNVAQIDLSNCRRSQFVFSCKTILIHIQNPFYLKFSMKRLDESIDHFFIKLKSHNLDDLLESMTLLSVTDQTIDSVVQYLNCLLNLRSLTIIYDSFKSAKNSLEKIMNTNMVSLTDLNIDYARKHNEYLQGESSAENCSKILNIKNIVLRVPICLNTLHNLLYLLPEIVSIEVGLLRTWRNNDIDKPSIGECSPNLEKLIILVHNNDIIYFEAISKLLQELPQLRTFWYSAFICDNNRCKEYHNGRVWEHLIRTYLPNLIDFRLNVGLEREMGTGPSDVIQSFCSPFWTQEKKWWFVADKPDNNADTIELYSLPPPDHGEIIFCPKSEWASNSPNPNFKSVRTLGLQRPLHPVWAVVGKHRYYTNVTTIRPPHDFDIGTLDDVAILSNENNTSTDDDTTTTIALTPTLSLCSTESMVSLVTDASNIGLLSTTLLMKVLCWIPKVRQKYFEEIVNFILNDDLTTLIGLSKPIHESAKILK